MSANRVLVGSMYAAAVALSAACHDGLLHAPAQTGRAEIVLSAAPSNSSVLMGGPIEAYAQTNRLYVQFSASDETTRMERTIPFDPSAQEVRATFDVPLQDVTESMFFWVELRRGADPVFYGSNEVTLTAGEDTQTEVVLEPHVWDVTCSGPLITFDELGLRFNLSAEPIFVTGDTIPGLDVTFGVGGPVPSAVTVDVEGSILSVSEGDAEVYCFAGNGMGTRPVRVYRTVAFIDITPSSVDIQAGGTVTLAVTAYAPDEDIITGHPVQWTSGNTAIATVSQSGVVTGVSPGQTSITARVDTATASVPVVVR